MAEVEAKLKKKKKKLFTDKKTMKELKQKVDKALAQKEVVEKRAELAEGKVLQAIEEYKKSSTIEDEMIETGISNYQVGLADCKENVTELFPHLDLHKVIISGEDVEEGSKQAVERTLVEVPNHPATFFEVIARAEEITQGEESTEPWPIDVAIGDDQL